MKKNDVKVQKHTIWLREGDVQFLREVYAGRGTTASKVIRKTVSTLVDNIKSRPDLTNLNLEEPSNA